MKLTTKRPKFYPGDRSIQILFNNNVILNLFPKTINGVRGYENDRTSKFCQSITEAKQIAKDIINKETANVLLR